MRTLFLFFLLFLTAFVRLNSQPQCVKDVCCCDSAINIGVPSGVFQDSPIVSPGTLRTFFAGEQYGSWTIVNGSIDVKGPNYFNLSNGNPNGKSQFIDLNGQQPGTISTNLTGMVPGMTYTLVFWYALNPAADTAGCTVQIAGGAWLNAYWTATNPGNVLWLQNCYTFVAQDSTAELRFIGDGVFNLQAGMLLDDMSLWVCPIDSIPPVFTSIPVSPLIQECSDSLPPPDYPPAVDDCTGQVTPASFSEQMTPDSCMYTLLRTWVVSDDCGNTATATHEIRVRDTQAPVFVDEPVDYVVNCGDDYAGIFNLFLTNHGDGVAQDNCAPAVTWSHSFTDPPDGTCKTTPVTFTVSDDCGNAQSIVRNFTVEDITPPLIIRQALNDTVYCTATGADSLAVWLADHGGALAEDPCGPIQWSHDFAGDSNALAIQVTFTAIDGCFNSSSTTAFFFQPFVSDTVLLFDDTCDPALAGSDTSFSYLGNCETVTVLTTLLLPSDTTNLTALTCLPDSVGLYTQSLTNQFGCDSIVYTDVSLAVLPQIAVVPTNYSGFGVSCFDGSDGGATASTQGVGPFQYAWSQGVASGATVGNLPAGDYTVIVTDGNGCKDTTTFALTEPPVLNATYSVTELDCVENETGAIDVHPEGGVLPYNFALENGGVQSDSSFTGLQSGVYAVTTFDGNGCTVSGTVVIPQLIPVTVDLGDDYTIELGDEAVLEAEINLSTASLQSVTWTPADTSNCALCLTQTAMPAVTSTYSVLLVDKKGCTSEDSITIEVKRRIRVYVPNVFSPNDDGRDDEFLVFAKPGQVDMIRLFAVYDRWGNKLFERRNIAPNDPSQGWRGTAGDDDALPGVYGWVTEILFIDGTIEMDRGDVTLLR